MNPDDFRSPAAGKVIMTRSGYHALIPAPLPLNIQYNHDLVLALYHADTALGELSGLGRLIPNPHLLINPYIRREAVLSSRIEGTKADLFRKSRSEYTLNPWLNYIDDQTTLMTTFPLGCTFSKYQKASGVLLNG